MSFTSPYCQLTPGCENPRMTNMDGCYSCLHEKRKAEKEALKPKKVYSLPKPTKRIAPRSDKRAAEELIYNAEVKEWKIDKVCLVRIGSGVCGKKCADNHHRRGRNGDRLRDRRYWFPVCREHHDFIGANPEWARDEGYSILRLPNDTIV